LNVSLVGLHGGVQQLQRGVQSLNLEVIGGELRLIQQAGILELRRRSLREGGIGRHAAPDASPYVDLISQINRYGVKASYAGRRARSGIRQGRRGGHGGKQTCLGDAHRRFGLAELRLGGQYILVRDAHLVFERVEPRIVVNLPPGCREALRHWVALPSIRRAALL